MDLQKKKTKQPLKGFKVSKLWVRISASGCPSKDFRRFRKWFKGLSSLTDRQTDRQTIWTKEKREGVKEEWIEPRETYQTCEAETGVDN